MFGVRGQGLSAPPAAVAFTIDVMTGSGFHHSTIQVCSNNTFSTSCVFGLPPLKAVFCVKDGAYGAVADLPHGKEVLTVTLVPPPAKAWAWPKVRLVLHGVEERVAMVETRYVMFTVFEVRRVVVTAVDGSTTWDCAAAGGVSPIFT